jgi:hypothetical protein
MSSISTQHDIFENHPFVYIFSLTCSILFTSMSNFVLSQVLVAHTCSPSYSGGKDQEDLGLKSVWANRWRDPVLKKPLTRKGLVEWLKV